MTDEIPDELFEKRHDRLWRIAFWANVFAWISIFVHVIMIFGTYNQAHAEYRFYNNTTPFSTYLSTDIGYTVSLFFDLFGVLIRGVACWLVLKGISLGLYMIVETDTNYRERGNSHDG